jgi:hypothetical protein
MRPLSVNENNYTFNHRQNVFTFSFDSHGPMFSSICLRCGKALTDPVSMSIGLGPICIRKTERIQEGGNKMDLSDVQAIEQEPECRKHGEDIFITREDGELITNVPHTIVYHSPTGFEIGYMGSGPTELAWNILYLFLDGRRARMLKHEFKSEFLSCLKLNNGEYWRMSREDVNAWIDSHIDMISQ